MRFWSFSKLFVLLCPFLFVYYLNWVCDVLLSIVFSPFVLSCWCSSNFSSRCRIAESCCPFYPGVNCFPPLIEKQLCHQLFSVVTFCDCILVNEQSFSLFMRDLFWCFLLNVMTWTRWKTVITLFVFSLRKLLVLSLCNKKRLSTKSILPPNIMIWYKVKQSRRHEFNKIVGLLPKKQKCNKGSWDMQK